MITCHSCFWLLFPQHISSKPNADSEEHNSEILLPQWAWTSQVGQDSAETSCLEMTVGNTFKEPSEINLYS